MAKRQLMHIRTVFMSLYIYPPAQAGNPALIRPFLFLVSYLSIWFGA